MSFRFWNSGPATGGFHMAVDRVLLRRLNAGQSEPFVRVYTWEPACVTLGYSQKPAQEIDFAELSRNGWTWAKRPTGGRAVLHANEFTYTIAAPVALAPWCASRDQSYAMVGQALQTLLRLAGVQTELARGDSSVMATNLGPSRPCFASTSKLEVTLQGKKLVGSAQRRLRNSFLQHGSLPLDDGFLDLVRILPLTFDEKVSYRKDMQSHAHSLGSFGEITFNQLAGFAQQAFSETLELDFVSTGLTSDELEEIEWEWQAHPNGFDATEQAEAELP